MKPHQLALDIGIAAGLFVALLVVFLLDPRADSGAGPQLDYTVLRGTDNADFKRLKLAVSSPPRYDHMGGLLDKMGEGYQFDNVPAERFSNPDELHKYDIAFFTCAPSTSEDLVQNRTLRRFVEQGGTLYASDLRFDAIRGAFPEFVPDVKDLPPAGAGQQLTALSSDKGLTDLLQGDRVHLTFDLSGWRPAAFRRGEVQLPDGSTARTTVYLEGQYVAVDKRFLETPLLVSFPCGKGAVVFTSFHNAKQTDANFEKLLKYVVMRVVTARAEAQAAKNLLDGGLKPAQSSLVSVNPQQPTAASKYSNLRDGRLQFVLVFNAGQGAELEFRLRSPDGKSARAQGEGTFTIDVPNARAGEWEISVTALKLPYPDFPFTVTVAEPK